MADISLVKLPSDEFSLNLTDEKSTLAQVLALCHANVDPDLYRHILSVSHMSRIK